MNIKCAPSRENSHDDLQYSTVWEVTMHQLLYFNEEKYLLKTTHWI